MSKKAIVTMVIGPKYSNMFENSCRKDWEFYCKKYGYDLILIDNPLDVCLRAKNRSPAWQKLLICSQDWSCDYDQLVWIDADVLINFNSAPDICMFAPIEKVSAVEAYSIPNRRMHNISLSKQYQAWSLEGVDFIDNLLPYQFYNERGIVVGEDFDLVIQSGVFVCSPKKHKELFEHVYYSYEDCNGPKWNYEMPAFSYEIVKNNLHHWIEPEFNYCVLDVAFAFYPFIFGRPQRFKFLDKINNVIKNKYNYSNFFISGNKLNALKNIYDLGFFIHFAGCSSLMQPLSRRLYKSSNGLVSKPSE